MRGLDKAALPEKARVRLTLAIEDVRVERLLLPRYRGGVQIDILPSALSPNDVELRVLPSDPSLRALVRALSSGTGEEAEAVRSLLVSRDGRAQPDPQDDLWEMILTSLLAIRFPDVFPPVSALTADALVERAPWAYDGYVILARHRLYSAEDDRAVVAPAVLELLRKAQTTGSPYFSYTNQLFSEMIEALAGYFDRNGPSQERKKAARIRARWVRDQPLVASAGASFSWLRRDQQLLRQGILAPDRTPKGVLSRKSTAALFSGRIAGGRISLGHGDRPRSEGDEAAETDPQVAEFSERPDCPANARPVEWPDDPNLDRFGGEAAVAGYGLKADFDDMIGDDVTSVTMTVDAGSEAVFSPGDVAWFCLHPTFHPQWVRVLFGNRRAVLTVQAWGGFTVGVWLPGASVELELDLANLPLAPERIRKL